MTVTPIRVDPSPLPNGLQVMAKPTGARCNLDCRYCFFLAKEQLYPGSGFRMDPDVHEAYISQLLAAHGQDDEVVVAFQGGEPTLMGPEFFLRTVQLERRWRRPGQRVLNTLQTNGTLLDDEWGALLRKHDVLVGLSIDGPAAMHDAHRVDKGGKPTFARVMRGLDVLRQHGVAWNALVTVNSANVDQAREVYTFLRDDLGARFIQFIPIVERASPHSVDAARYGQFLVEVFEEWICQDVGEVFVNVFDTALAHWLGMDQVGMCVHARTCGSALVLEHNGDLYSCDHYVADEYRIGNITNGRTLAQLATSQRQTAFGLAKRDTLPGHCRRCDVRFACNGGCPKDRFLTTPDGEPGLNYLCGGYQRFFRYVDRPMRMMADLVRRGLDAHVVCARWRRWKERHGDEQIDQSRPTSGV
jgi:uncharacterized protein